MVPNVAEDGYWAGDPMMTETREDPVWVEMNCEAVGSRVVVIVVLLYGIDVDVGNG